MQSHTKQPGAEQKSKPKSSISEKETSETTALQEKLSQANNKVAEFRNQCDKLKKDLKVAHKVLAKEVGEGFNITSLLNDSSGWRGRQQQITSLQNKVSELKGQLTQVARSGSATSNNILLRSVMMSPSTAPSQYDEKHRSVLKKIEKDRKDAQEKTQAEFESLDQEHTKLQQKHDAAKARNRVLASELKGLKAQVQTLLEKGAHDDELIAALMREQQQLKSVASKKAAPPPPKAVSAPQDRAQIEHLQQECHERDGRIRQLEQELGKAKQALQNTTEKYRELTQRETKSVACSTVDLPTNEERFDRAASGYGVVDVSNQGPGSVGPIPAYGYVNGSVEGPLSKGPLAERAEDSGAQNNGYMPHRRQATPSQHQPEGPSRTQVPSVPGSPARRHVRSRGSASGMSGKGSAQGYQLPPTPPSGGRGSRGRRNSAGGSEEIHLLRSQVQESKSLCQAAEVERDRLLELVTLLQRRVDEAKNSELDATSKWQQERRQVVHMEKQLSRVQSGQQGVAKGRGKGYGTGSAVQERQAKTEDSEELATR
ncbi:Coiled-coil domain-containing protein 13 [Desmophyllum pertusum]|uniref:Coiled-coil domain-containing protein 13 n=1 Tax=Desmophyllum pertusum TaxID=174260 RepID=A0A9W9ZF49_9CNID|nr:Coiled-coil domain-containing protein 13 [Desmophyllum pertusum]